MRLKNVYSNNSYGIPLDLPASPAMQRKRALKWLASPYYLVIVAFALSVIVTALGYAGRPTLLYIGAASYAIVMSFLVWGAAYTLGILWLIFGVKKTDPNWLDKLKYFPLVVGAFIWFPVTIITKVPTVERLKIYLLLCAVSLVIGYAWIFIVKYVLTRRG